MDDDRAPKIPAALSSPSINRGVGFTREQRRQLGLTGRLPPGVLTLEQQAERVWRQLQGMSTDLARNLSLDQLHYRHQVLFFKVLSDHLAELMPVACVLRAVVSWQPSQEIVASRVSSKRAPRPASAARSSSKPFFAASNGTTSLGVPPHFFSKG